MANTKSDNSLCFDSFTAYFFFPTLTFSIAATSITHWSDSITPLVKFPISTSSLLTTVPFATEKNFPFMAIKLPDFPSQMPPKTLIPTNNPFRLMPTKSKLDNNEAAGTLKQCCCWQCPPLSWIPHLILNPWAVVCFYSTQQDGNPAPGWVGDPSPTVLLPSHLSQVICTCSPAAADSQAPPGTLGLANYSMARLIHSATSTA